MRESFFLCIYRRARRVMEKPHTRVKSDASASTSARNASGSGCRAILLQTQVKIASNAISVSFRTNRYMHNTKMNRLSTPKTYSNFDYHFIACSAHWKNPTDSTWRINRRYIYIICAINDNYSAIIVDNLESNTRKLHIKPYFSLFTFFIEKEWSPIDGSTPVPTILQLQQMLNQMGFDGTETNF